MYKKKYDHTRYFYPTFIEKHITRHARELQGLHDKTNRRKQTGIVE